MTRAPRAAAALRVAAALAGAALGTTSAGASAVHAGAAPADFDVIIEHGHVVDGSGSPWYAADVGIRAGHIAAIGQLGSRTAKRRIDAAGRVVAPGFIDMLGQSEFTMLVDPRVPSKIYQGITSEVTGEGQSAAPLLGEARERGRTDPRALRPARRLESFGGYFARLEHQGMGINLASYVGATSVRETVIGTENRRPRAPNWPHAALVAAAMEEGAMGLSTSLQYAPAPYAAHRRADRARQRGGGASAASMRPTCARNAMPSRRRWMKHSASRAKLAYRWRSGI